MSYPALGKTNRELASQTWYFACCNETMGIFSLCVLDFIDINAGSYMYMYFFCIFMDIFICWFFFKESTYVAIFLNHRYKIPMVVS